MSRRQNHITIRVQYTKTRQNIKYRGVGVFGRINMSTGPLGMAATPIAGGVDQKAYWSAILQAVHDDVLARLP